jgi:predicted nucleic acid-binding protein
LRAVFDTNIHIGWFRERAYEDLFRDRLMTRYLSSVVLMELWSGALTRQAARYVEHMQSPYVRADRLVHPTVTQLISAGQLLSDLPARHRSRIREAGFVNDVLIALSCRAIGAVLYTENRSDFTLIAEYVAGLQVVYAK